jgi:hypothetical protein
MWYKKLLEFNPVLKQEIVTIARVVSISYQFKFYRAFYENLLKLARWQHAVDSLHVARK